VPANDVTLAERLCERRLSWQTDDVAFQPLPEPRKYRQGLGLPRRIFEIRCLVPDPRLDRIQSGDPLQRLRRKSRFALRLRDFEEVSAAMGLIWNTR
jgi:hypothetical protein